MKGKTRKQRAKLIAIVISFVISARNTYVVIITLTTTHVTHKIYFIVALAAISVSSIQIIMLVTLNMIVTFIMYRVK